MKNIRVILSLLPVLALTFFIYLSTLGFSHAPLEKSKSEFKKPSASMILAVHITDVGGNHCLTGDYTYCVNGGPAIQVFSDYFEVEVPCGDDVTICVTSSAGCTGSWTGPASCEPQPRVTIDISPFGARCNCQ